MTQHTETATPKRYAPGYEVDESSRGIRLVMDQADTGDFIRFSDHDHIVAALQARIDALMLEQNQKPVVGETLRFAELIQHLESVGWRPDEINGEPDCVDEGAARAADAIKELLRELATASLELTAERDAVAQYIGERNGLREKNAELQTLADILIICGEDEAVEQKHLADKLRALIDKKIELRAQLAQAQQDLNDARNGWESAAAAAREADEKVVQAQNEAYQRGQNDQANHDGPIVNAAYRDGRNKALDEVLQGCARDLTDMMLESCNLMDAGLQDAAWAHRIRADQECVRYNIVLALKSPNSAEGEPG